MPCLNGGTCEVELHSGGHPHCRCPALFSGRRCEIRQPNPTLPAIPETVCPYPECQQQAGDRVCDQQCNRHECKWDSGDCSLNWKKSWESCAAPVPCWQLFRNGRCDPECDNAECLFDSFECQPAPSLCK